MAAEIVLLSLTQLQNFAPPHQQQQLNPSSTPGQTMWNPKQAVQEDDDESWEVRAFAEDTGNAMGTTWPPRSYACTFCRREFRSAQALGGHMNVHRRDRARLHQNGSNTGTATATTSSSALIIPTQELMENGGLCLLYSIPNPNPNPNPSPNPNGFFSPTTMQMDSHSTIFPIPPYQTNNFRVGPCSINSSLCHSSNTEPSSSTCNDNNRDSTKSNKDSAIEELDLELRLGRSVID